jgi:hypothetical protein
MEQDARLLIRCASYGGPDPENRLNSLVEYVCGCAFLFGVVMSVIDLGNVIDRMVQDLLDVQAGHPVGRHQAGRRATQVVGCESW